MKRLNPDIKAAKAITKALEELPDDHARKRILEWATARTLGLPGFVLPSVSVWQAEQDKPYVNQDLGAR